MSYQEKAEPLISFLKAHKTNIYLTDGYKEITTFSFKLSTIPLNKETAHAEIQSQEEYLLITDYIVSEVNEKMFKFLYDSFKGDNIFLYLR